MNFLEKKIVADGCVNPGNVLKVDNFLNHQIDIHTIRQVALELKHRLGACDVTKILTIESSGIAIATILGELYKVPVVFAKKSASANCTDDQYISKAYSYTHKTMNSVCVSKPYIQASDKVFIVDDFLACGEAMSALIDITNQAGAEIVGLGVAIEKGFQSGGQILRQKGYRVEAVACVESMNSETGTISFRQN